MQMKLPLGLVESYENRESFNKTKNIKQKQGHKN